MGFTLIVLTINFFIPSQVNGFFQGGINTSLSRIIENETAERILLERYNHPVFRSRPIVLEAQRLAQSRLGLPAQLSFNLIQGISLFLLFVFSPRLTDLLGNNGEGFTAQLLLVTALPILFAYFGSIFTYDDMLQYALLQFFLIFLFSGSSFWAMIFFFLACVCRETSLVYLLVVFFFLYAKAGWSYGLIRQLAPWVVVVIFFVAFVAVYMPPHLTQQAKTFFWEERWLAWQQNFGTLDAFRESTTHLAMMTGLYLFLLMTMRRKHLSARKVYWAYVGIACIGLNAALVSVSGLVREIRLLFPPLILVIPLVAREAKAIGMATYEQIRSGQRARLLIPSLVIAIALAFGWYHTYTRGTGYLLQAYAFLYFFLLAVNILSWSERRADPASQGAGGITSGVIDQGGL